MRGSRTQLEEFGFNEFPGNEGRSVGKEHCTQNASETAAEFRMRKS